MIYSNKRNDRLYGDGYTFQRFAGAAQPEFPTAWNVATFKTSYEAALTITPAYSNDEFAFAANLFLRQCHGQSISTADLTSWFINGVL